MTDVVSAGEAKEPSPPREFLRTPLRPAVFVLAFTILSWAQVPAQAQDTPSAAQDISGVWWITRYSEKIEPAGGRALPFTAMGRAVATRNAAGLRDGTLVDVARRYCVPDGVPRILGNPYPFEIIQTPGQITILYEINHAIRVIPMDRAVPTAEEVTAYPYYNGHSVGRWDGDTLIVETVGFNEKTFIDAAGTPHSGALRTVERIRTINDGRQLEDVVTVHDPVMFTQDWSARFVYDLRNDVTLTDYVCGERHRDISSVSGVPRR